MDKCNVSTTKKPLIKWPDQEQLYRTMPLDFKRKFDKCVAIIDCFKVFMERPPALMTGPQTWSNYKQHNMCKFLIGITPQGTILFVSKAWEGCVSDVYFAENCGILENLINGNLILVDRGFTVQDANGLYCTEVKVPSFTKGSHNLANTKQTPHVNSLMYEYMLNK